MAPLCWLTAARLREARRLLEISDLPVDDVAAAAVWAAPPTCACIWRATPGRRPPPAGPPTRAANGIPEAPGIG